MFVWMRKETFLLLILPTLVFTETKRSAEDLFQQLSRAGFGVAAIHGDRDQNARERALKNFSTGRLPILIATNVASRGLDIENIELVINFDLPQDMDQYVHRIGRTGRAGKKGLAVSFITNANAGVASKLVDILNEARQPVPQFLLDMTRSNRGGGGGGSSRGGGGGGGRGRGGGFRSGGNNSFYNGGGGYYNNNHNSSNSHTPSQSYNPYAQQQAAAAAYYNSTSTTNSNPNSTTSATTTSTNPYVVSSGVSYGPRPPVSSSSSSSVTNSSSYQVQSRAPVAYGVGGSNPYQVSMGWTPQQNNGVMAQQPNTTAQTPTSTTNSSSSGWAGSYGGRDYRFS